MSRSWITGDFSPSGHVLVLLSGLPNASLRRFKASGRYCPLQWSQCPCLFTHPSSRNGELLYCSQFCHFKTQTVLTSPWKNISFTRVVHCSHGNDGQGFCRVGWPDSGRQGSPEHLEVKSMWTVPVWSGAFHWHRQQNFHEEREGGRNMVEHCN